ncbi:SDR family oxidoreductase [Erythrobacter sp. EC-HK427]|uniref:SDR family oxidoreductase n=1 Tax=Erythrobacter sp. EC-HK427 TaxID=2038396 RepID=UPI0012596821|nr:SDR family oxidoreductase [Erythrobacter sp. EC-HK427]VVT00294.1 Short-chain dehydrogenase [Erythrobacter sp. EC-HK427]
MSKLAGKIALVTGGGSGLGKADCLRLAEAGAIVYVTDVNEAAAQDVAAQIGEGAVALRHDVASEAEWQAVYERIAADHGRLDILVNNAGIVIVADPEQTTIEQFDKTMDIMCKGVFIGCKLGLPLLAKSENGSIINMCSNASHFGFPPFFAYSAAKGAVRSMSKSIAIHCQDQGYKVRCNTIHPSAIETPMVQGAMGRPGEEQEIPQGVLPAGSIGAPDDVASLIVFLCSDDARFLTGGEYLIDNGSSIRP